VTDRIVIGTRGSKLALAQTHWVRRELSAAHPGLNVEVEVIRTKGDKILDSPLSQIGGKGLFTAELDRALIDGKIDMAVHSLKDLPTTLEPGLALGAVPRREDARDALISREGLSLDDLPAGSTVATSSLRRRAQVLHRRPDLRVIDIRGNLDTRLRKAAEPGGPDALIVALAGLRRMGWEDRVTQALDPEIMLPAVAQGALGVEVREGDARIQEIVSALNHPETALAARAERAFLRRLEGGCQVPVGALGRVENDTLHLAGMVADVEGTRIFSDRIDADPGDPESAGVRLAEILLTRGADAVLKEIFEKVGRSSR